MTNIMAVKVVEKPSSKTSQPTEYVLCCADSQSMTGMAKDTNVQKLFRVGNAFMMGTGTLEYVVSTVSALLQHPNPGDSPMDIGKKVLEITAPLQAKEPGRFQTGFIIAGYDQGKPVIYSVEAVHPEPYMREVREQRVLSLSGSGARFAIPAVNRDVERGVGRQPTDLAEGMLVLFDLAQTAGQDVGVDTHNLQFGFLGPGGKMMQLFSPDVFVGITPTYYEEYVVELMGVRVQRQSDLLKSPKKRMENFEYRIAVYDVLHAFYSAFTESLDKFRGLDSYLNMVHSGLKTGECKPAEYQRRARGRKEQKVVVDQMIRAWLSGSLDGLVQATRLQWDLVGKAQERVAGLRDFQIAEKSKGAGKK